MVTGELNGHASEMMMVGFISLIRLCLCPSFDMSFLRFSVEGPTQIDHNAFELTS